MEVHTQKAGFTELRGWQRLIVFLVACLVFVSRRPDAVFHAQFWGEDGFTFYADAYNLGWFSALIHPYFGYFHLVPRLAAAFSLLVPFYRAPLVMNLVAIAADALPVSILLSSRCAAWGSLRFRALLAAGYLALPGGSIEIFSILTSVQWVLVIAAFLIIIGSLPRNHVERSCDVLLLLASGLSGPFCFFLLPIAVVVAYRKRERWRWVPTIVLLLCASVQAWSLLILRTEIRSATLGATPYLFLRILGENIYLSTFFGAAEGLIPLGRHSFLLELSIALVGTVGAAMLFVKARRPTRLFCILAAMVLAASLMSPTSALSALAPHWPELAQTPGIRYWFLPALAIVWLLMDASRNNSKILKWISAPLLVLYFLLTPFLWRVSIFHDLRFEDEAARFQAAPAGATVIIPINPAGHTMRLIKHDRAAR